MITRSRILAWKSPWTEERGGLCPRGYTPEHEHDGRGRRAGNNKLVELKKKRSGTKLARS